MAQVDTNSTVEQIAPSGLHANVFAEGANSDSDAASGGETGNAASAEDRSFGFSNEFFDAILQAGNYGTADVVNDREDRIIAEMDPNQQPEAVRSPEAVAAPEALPSVSPEAPLVVAERMQSLEAMNAPQPVIEQGGLNFGALLAGTGICLSSQVIGTCEHVPDAHAMQLAPVNVAAVEQEAGLARA
jgi:hypothetical protein